MNTLAPLIEIVDYSIYIFALAVVVVAVLLAIIIIYFRAFLMKKRTVLRHKIYDNLLKIDFTNPKQAAYDISSYGRYFIDDSDRVLKMYEILFDRLDGYKYAKSVELIDDETMGYYHLFIEAIDV